MSDAHIHAYVDGQLKRERGQSLQSILGDLPEKYEQLEEYQRINDSLKTTLQPILLEPIPNGILQVFSGMGVGQPAANKKQKKVNAVQHNVNPKNNKPSQAAAPVRDQAPSGTKSGGPGGDRKKSKEPKESNGGVEIEMENEFEYKYRQLKSFGNALRTIPLIVIFCIVSFIIGWNVRNQFRFGEERVAEFVNHAINSDNIFADVAPEFNEPRSIDRVLRKRFTWPLSIPDTKELELQGGRLLPYGEYGVAAMLSYKASGKEISLYFNQMAGLVSVEIPFCEYVKPKTVCYWHRADMNFAVISEMKEDKLRGVAKTFLQQLLHLPNAN